MIRIFDSKITYSILIILVLLIQPSKYPFDTPDYNLYNIFCSMLLIFVLPILILMLSKQTIEAVILICVLILGFFTGLDYSFSSIAFISVFSIVFELLKILVYLAFNYKNINLDLVFNRNLNIYYFKYENIVRLILSGTVVWFLTLGS